MKSLRWHVILGCAALLAVGPASQAQQGRAFSVGYCYPAGCQQGATSEHIIAGQFLNNVTNVFVTGAGVQAVITDYFKATTQGEARQLQMELERLFQKRRFLMTKDPSLGKIKGVKGGKAGKPGKSLLPPATPEDLAKKYANATWTDADDKRVAEIRKKLATVVRRPANPAISELVTVQITAAPDAAPGPREIRLGTANGLSNPLVFCVGQLPEFSEKASRVIVEQKSAVAKTAFGPKSTKARPEIPVKLPATVNGQILPGEVDRYRFTAAKGQKLVMAVAARQLIPYISDAVPGWFQATLSLYDSKGKELAYDDDFRFNPDPVLYYEIPADGEYVVEVKDSIFRGREDFVYRITIGETPFITSIFPLGGHVGEKTTVELKGWNLPATTLKLDDATQAPGIHSISVRKDNHVSNFVPFAVDKLPECLAEKSHGGKSHVQRVTLPVIINGRIEKADDSNVFHFDGKAGDRIVAEVMARRLNSPLDSVLKLTDATGNQIAFNDDNTDKGAGLTTHHADSYLTATLPKDGAYLLRLSDTQHKGGPEYAYRLRLSAPQPDFALRVVPSSINARVGTTVPVTVYALRKDGFTGDIAIALKKASGFKLAGARIPAKEDKVKVTLTMPPTPRSEPVTLQVEGRATINGQEVARAAVPAQDMMQAFEYRHLVPSQELQVAVTGRAASKISPVKVVGDMPVKIPAGGTVSFKIAASSKDKTFSKKLHLELAEAPDGIAIKKVSPSGNGMEILLESDAAKVTPGQKGNLLVGAFPPKPAKTPKAKSAPGKAGPTTMLPAIPYEIVQK
ncbi:MAG: PPC domain-containing protein [Verrucomicrobia bacterium]|nr:PPC domain-containing protein [Verrucomicrobiota bacterium]